MLFLGQASNFRGFKTWKHFFAVGGKHNSDELRAYIAAHYGTSTGRVALFHNGRSALTVAIRELLPEGGEVVITGLTCIAVVQAVRAAGCEPVYADIDVETLHYGKKELLEVLKNHPDVKAVVVQNNLGNPADIENIEKICKKHKLFLIEDLAHCAGVRYADGREAGTVGHAAAMSFGKGKSIDTISGGAVIFSERVDITVKQPEKRPKLGECARDRWYPVFGHQIRVLYYLGLGKLFTAFLIKIGCIERSADSRLSTETRLAHWQAKLAIEQIKNLPKKAPGRPPLRQHYFVLHRKELLRKLEKMGYIFTDTWYDVPVSPSRYYAMSNFDEEECPVTTAVAKHIINVPTNYPDSELTSAYKIIKEYQIDEED